MCSPAEPRLGRRLAKTIAASIAILGAGAPIARAQTPAATVTVPAYRFRILGVFDEANGEPVEGVDVIDVLSNAKATTTTTGTVSLFFLPDGGSMVRLRKIGYEMQTFMVAIDSANRTPITVLLKRSTTLPTVLVTDSAPKALTPHMREFEEHRKGGFGQFLPDSVFRKSENTTMANLLISHFSGMQTVETSSGATLLVSARTQCKGLAFSACQRPNCFVTIYIDGVRVFDASMGASASRDMGRLSPIDFAAAEFYPGGSVLPPGLSPTNSQCGTLVLYTRDG